MRLRRLPSLLCAAVADCFVLSFRAVARASKLDWTHLDCHVEGTLDRAEGTTRFTRYLTRATLRKRIEKFGIQRELSIR
mgnify:CR=1 FL=1